MLRITFINVGYGDSILVEELKSGRRIFSMLVDGGNPYDQRYKHAYDSHAGQTPAWRYLQGRGIERLDLVVLTHFHLDHIGGIPDVVKTFPCGDLWSNYVFSGRPPAIDVGKKRRYRPESRMMVHSLRLLAELSDFAGHQNKEIHEMRRNEFNLPLTSELSVDRFGVDEAIYARMDGLVRDICAKGGARGATVGSGDCAAEDVEAQLFGLDKILNASCAALRLSYRGRSVLLAADLPATYWYPILDAGHTIGADILKFSHHGQKDGVSKRFASAVNPSNVVFCVSEDNPFHCPNPSVFSFFDATTRFDATGIVPLPPAWKPHPAHSAVVFEIGDDSSIRLMLQ
ncbi:hypothetical protein SPIRO4BDMA_50151 [uncultured spirochete]|jgi:beta-lactamase superfamily II metal-dependent hydrolase|uniref:Metallo-beta-lactamase domain-containing protein n=1 Tax=uncultured spirochete TaxID=156406 RepID=A0A3P3XQQ0_9SPIR|nr:hypothetical protein SPIRO4BDMA_50151 [uncultured spirochete]